MVFWSRATVKYLSVCGMTILPTHSQCALLVVRQPQYLAHNKIYHITLIIAAFEYENGDSGIGNVGLALPRLLSGIVW